MYLEYDHLEEVARAAMAAVMAEHDKPGQLAVALDRCPLYSELHLRWLLNTMPHHASRWQAVCALSLDAAPPWQQRCLPRGRRWTTRRPQMSGQLKHLHQYRRLKQDLLDKAVARYCELLLTVT